MSLPGWAAPLAHRPLRRFLLGNLASATGTWSYNVVAVIVIYDRTGSASLVALVTAVQYGASLLLAPVSGALADRVDRRRLITITQAASAAMAATLTVAWWAGADSILVLVAASAGLGIAHAFGHPSMQAIVPALAPPDQVRQSLTLMGVSFNAARALGPAVGVGLLAGPGPTAAFAVNTATFVVFAIAVRGTRGAGAATPVAPPPPDAPDADTSVGAGLTLVRRSRDLQIVLLGVFGAVFLSEPAATLVAPLAEELGGGDGLVGALASGFGVGATVLGITLGWLTRTRPPAAAAGWSTIIGAGGLAVVASGLGPVPAVMGMAVAGAGFLSASSNLTTALHSQIDDAVRGRIMAIWSVVFLGSRPVTSLALGSTSDLFGPRVALALPVVVGALIGARLVMSTFASSASSVERSAA
ncbi:MAG: MFS transporter [Acidimicrobiales bacterium]